MNIFIKANKKKENYKTAIETIIEVIRGYNHSYILCDTDICNEKDVENCHLIMSVGGDGTLLAVGILAAKYNIPILGINTGRLGFLTAIEDYQLKEHLKDFFDGNGYEIKSHTLLKAKINNGRWQYCLNDVVVAKNMFSNTIVTNVHSNDSCIAKIVCDCLIISTATGSTAYSLSAGGPIVDSDLEALIISPVAVHSLNATPMVFAKDKHITVKFDTDRKQDIYVSFDGDNHKKICEKDIVHIQLSNRNVKIYADKNLGQFAKVDKKLKLR